jgi:AraC-like DNA-binding protein
MRVGPHHRQSAGDSDEWADGLPDVSLRDRVVAYTGFVGHAPATVRRREAPSGEVILVLSDGGFSANPVAGALTVQPFSSFLVGLCDQPIGTEYHGDRRGIQVRLDPLAAYALFGVPMHEIKNRTVALSDLLGPTAHRWEQQVLSARDRPEQFAILDRLLDDRMASGTRPSAEVTRAWRTLQRAGGVSKVDDLVSDAGCSHRHLAKLFRSQIGVNPKAAGRLLRFERAALMLATGRVSPSRVASVCGYADQSHLTREFGRLAGVTPVAARRSVR